MTLHNNFINKTLKEEAEKIEARLKKGMGIEEGGRNVITNSIPTNPLSVEDIMTAMKKIKEIPIRILIVVDDYYEDFVKIITKTISGQPRKSNEVQTLLGMPVHRLDEFEAYRFGKTLFEEDKADEVIIIYRHQMIVLEKASFLNLINNPLKNGKY